MNEGYLIVANMVFVILFPVLFIAVGGLYLIYKGYLKLLVLLSLLIGHMVLLYYMNTNPMVLPEVMLLYGKWFFNKN